MSGNGAQAVLTPNCIAEYPLFAVTAMAVAVNETEYWTIISREIQVFSEGACMVNVQLEFEGDAAGICWKVVEAAPV
jgi:hypothetical protein